MSHQMQPRIQYAERPNDLVVEILLFVLGNEARNGGNNDGILSVHYGATAIGNDGRLVSDRAASRRADIVAEGLVARSVSRFSFLNETCCHLSSEARPQNSPAPHRLLLCFL